MKLRGDGAFLDLELSERGPEDTPADEDLLVNVTVDVKGFTAADQNWIVAREWSGFLVELRTLVESRQGRATLVAVVPDELRIEFFSTDRAGHMAVKGQVHRTTADGFDLQLQFGFAFEPDTLPRVLSELQAFSTG